MSLRFIYGRAGSGKSHFCFQDIKSRIDMGASTPLIILVPEDFSFQAEKKLLKTIGETGILKAQVLSFKRMAYRVFGEVGGLTRQHMNAAGRCMLLHRIMEKLQGNLSVFSKAVKMQGFVDTISDIITELKIYGITPEILEFTRSKMGDDDILKEKISDINLIFTEFEKALHEKYIDSEDDLTILAQKLDKCHMFDGAEIWIDGFAVLTPQQYRIIEKLLQRAQRVNVTLCTDCLNGICDIESTDIFMLIKNMEKRIRKIAQDSNIDIEEPVLFRDDVCFKYKDNIEMGHLEKNIFAYPAKKYLSPIKCISLFKAVSKYTEVENIARDIIRLCRDENLRYSDITVVTKDIKGYEKLAGAIFSQYKIPYFLDKKRDINDNPLIVFIISAIEILAKNWSYESVFRYLKTGFAGIDREDVDLIENYVLASGIKGKRWAQDYEWTFWPELAFDGSISDEGIEQLRKINEIKNKIYMHLSALYTRIKGKKKSREIATVLFEFLCSLGISEKIESLIEEFNNEGELDLANEYNQIWNILIETLDQIVEVMGDEELSIDKFLKVLSIGFSEYKIGLIPPALDQIMLCSVERVKSQKVSVLYIMGLNDGVFPSTSDDEGILSDQDRERLIKHYGIQLAPNTREKVFEEQYLVYTTLTAADKYLKLSYPIADHEGRTMRPSSIIARLKKIFPKLCEENNIVPEHLNENREKDEIDLNLISKPEATFNELVAVKRKNADDTELKTLTPLWREVERWYEQNDMWRGKYQRTLSGINYSNLVAGINTNKIRSLYGKQINFSISRLEKYAQCPFSYFIQYGLKAKDRKVYELGAPDIGSFIHEILDSFSTYLDDKNISWRNLDKQWCISKISQIVDDTVANTSGSILSSTSRYKYLKERLKRIIIRAVWLIVLHIKMGGFEPAEHEVGFGFDTQYPPISIELTTGEKINLIGRIDRIDTMENDEAIYIRVVDYKSGNKDFNISDIYNGIELQLLIYLDAILEFASRKAGKKVIPAGILYFRIDDPIIRSKGEMVEEDIEKEIMKRLRMRGLLLCDAAVIKEMDREIQGSSIIIPAMIRVDGSLGSSSSTASLEDFIRLRSHVKSAIVNLCEEMLKGNITINPYKKRDIAPCTYCSYKSICRFDVSIKENNYRMIKDKKTDEVWNLIRKIPLITGGEN